MSLPEHLHPKTYWEKRCELLEESVEQLVIRLIHNSPPQMAHDLDLFMREWAKHLKDLRSEHPAPPAAALAGDTGGEAAQ